MCIRDSIHTVPFRINSTAAGAAGRLPFFPLTERLIVEQRPSCVQQTRAQHQTNYPADGGTFQVRLSGSLLLAAEAVTVSMYRWLLLDQK